MPLSVPRFCCLNTTKHSNSRHDESTIDFAYMPREDFPPQPEIEDPRPPLLPDNFVPPLSHTNNAQNDSHIESVVRPTISTVSATGTHIDGPSALSDVTDGHAENVDVYNLTKVSAAAAAKATEFTEAVAKETDERRGSLAAFVGGVVDDLFGPKRPSKI